MKRARKRDRAKRILKKIFVPESRNKEYYKPAREPLHRETTISDSLVETWSRFVCYMKDNASFFRQSSAAHFLSILAGIFAGIFLGSSEGMLIALPGLIVLVPTAIGMRGNVFSSLGSRLGSALHLGTVSRFSVKNRVVRQNIYSSLVISVLFSVFLAFIARLILLSFGIKSISLLSLVAISFIGGIISGMILLAMTFMITFVSYKRGWDPDNVTSPIITALGDMFTVPSLLFAAMIVISYSSYMFFISAVIFALCAASLFMLLKSKKSAFRQIVVQSSPILTLGIVLDAFAGMILQSNINSLAVLPIVLFLVPGFLEQGGNIGNILASRISTRLHLGTMDPKFEISKEARIEIINTYIFAFILFPLLGTLTLIAGSFLGIGGVAGYLMLKTVLIAGIIITTVITAVAFFISILSFRLNMDPDNTTLPLIASTADVVGVVSLIAVLHAFGVF
ncbi:MAG: magnesium transporter [Candidatus Aenigmarchaeota archaeon]|nr:magnesium transporter [Candidatus Aenigmarchaeota archaeon]